MQCPNCPEKPKLQKDTYAGVEPVYCYSCGWKLLADREYWGCNLCNLKLCTFCKICPQGHQIRRVKILNKTASPYHGNSYVCDNCRKPANPGADGVWHCVPCQFDLCESCAPK